MVFVQFFMLNIGVVDDVAVVTVVIIVMVVDVFWYCSSRVYRYCSYV